MEKLVLIDGNSLINRAFYAMPPLSTKEGVPTNAVYGFMNMFFKMLDEIKPSYVCVAFDLKAPTFRHKLFSDYKGTRKPMPDDLRPQIPLLKEVLSLMGIKTMEKEGFEADDIIGTIAKSTSVKTYIFTGDKDSFQLVDEETEVHFTRRGITDVEIYTLDNFKEKTSLIPSQIIDLKALMGDSSDNIPGVPGVGEKTALNLLQTYTDLDGVYANLEKIKGKLKEKLESGKDSAYLSKTLATIDVNSPIDCDLEKMKTPLAYSYSVKKKFIELEFKTLANKDVFETPTSIEEEKETKKVYPIIKVSSLSQLEPIFNAPICSYYMGKEEVHLSDGVKNYCLKFRSSLLDDGFALTEILSHLLPIFTGKNTLIVYNKKELKHFLKDIANISLSTQTEDLSIMKYLADFSGGTETFEEVINNYGEDLSAPALSLYNIYNILLEKLEKEEQKSLYYDVELPLSDVLYDMEVAGFKVDYQKLSETGKAFAERISNLEKEIRSLVDEPTLNVNSPVQLGELLFEKLKLAKGKKTKRGYSTSAEVLEGLESAHPVIPLILSYRKIQKLNSTYIEGIKPLINKSTGVINTTFNQTLTTTGRLSSKEPNLQNIPVREDEGKELRKFFAPKSEDRILITADYSQIELRLLAAFSLCPALVEAYKKGVDIHTATASKVFDVEVDKVSSRQRSSAKAVNFGIIYGVSEYGLAKQLKVAPFEAKNYITAYFKEYPEVKDYMDNNVKSAKETGYAKTLLGRRRYIRELASSNYNLRSFGERAAMNMPLQGSSADIIKLAMIGVSNRIKKEGLKSELILQVHDELIVDAYISEAEKIKKILKEEMEGAVKLAVDLTVSIGEGKTWFDAK